MPSNELYPLLSRDFVLRKLESPFAFNIPGDQLYELDHEAFEFLRKCDGKHPYSKLAMEVGEHGRESIQYMIDEGMLLLEKSARPRKIKAMQSPIPSLRYLLLNITDKCNLACKHCYIGKAGKKEIETGLFKRTVSQFEDMGGLKLMISGGEPLMHKGFWDLMDCLPSHELRIIILSNGTLIGKNEVNRLSEYVDEVQVSIDGIKGHDFLRGKGSYQKAMCGISALRDSGIPVSIATMVHRYNSCEFDSMQKLFYEMGIFSWSVDVPCITGNLKANPDYALPLQEA
ncbi:MAG TPA: radical SAM protein, partial [Candidatus Methanoperedens sp.]